MGQSTYHHEAGFLFGGKHAHPQVLFPVAELHHVKGYSFRDCKHNGHCPDQHHLHCLPHGDSYPLDPTPGCHCSVPAQRVGTRQEQIGVRKATVRKGLRRCRLELFPKALSFMPSSSTPEPSPSVEWERSETGAQWMDVVVAILGQCLLAIGAVPPFPTTPAVVPADHDPPLNLFRQDLNSVTGVSSCWISTLQDSTLSPSLNLA